MSDAGLLKGGLFKRYEPFFLPLHLEFRSGRECDCTHATSYIPFIWDAACSKAYPWWTKLFYSLYNLTDQTGRSGSDPSARFIFSLLLIPPSPCFSSHPSQRPLPFTPFRFLSLCHTLSLSFPLAPSLYPAGATRRRLTSLSACDWFNFFQRGRAIGAHSNEG